MDVFKMHCRLSGRLECDWKEECKIQNYNIPDSVCDSMYVCMYIFVCVWMDDCVRFQGGGFIGTGLILFLSSGLGSDYFAFTQKLKMDVDAVVPALTSASKHSLHLRVT